MPSEGDLKKKGMAGEQIQHAGGSRRIAQIVYQYIRTN